MNNFFQKNFAAAARPQIQPPVVGGPFNIKPFGVDPGTGASDPWIGGPPTSGGTRPPTNTWVTPPDPNAGGARPPMAGGTRPPNPVIPPGPVKPPMSAMQKMLQDLRLQAMRGNMTNGAPQSDWSPQGYSPFGAGVPQVDSGVMPGQIGVNPGGFDPGGNFASPNGPATPPGIYVPAKGGAPLSGGQMPQNTAPPMAAPMGDGSQIVNPTAWNGQPAANGPQSELALFHGFQQAENDFAANLQQTLQQLFGGGGQGGPQNPNGGGNFNGGGFDSGGGGGDLLSFLSQLFGGFGGGQQQPPGGMPGVGGYSPYDAAGIFAPQPAPTDWASILEPIFAQQPQAPAPITTSNGSVQNVPGTGIHSNVGAYTGSGLGGNDTSFAGGGGNGMNVGNVPIFRESGADFGQFPGGMNFPGGGRVGRGGGGGASGAGAGAGIRRFMPDWLGNLLPF